MFPNFSLSALARVPKAKIVWWDMPLRLWSLLSWVSHQKFDSMINANFENGCEELVKVIDWLLCHFTGTFTGPLAPIARKAGIGPKMAAGIARGAKMAGAIVTGNRAARVSYVASRQAAQAGNMAKVNAAMVAGDTDMLRSMVYKGQNLVADSGKFPPFYIKPGKMEKINKMLGYSINTERPKAYPVAAADAPPVPAATTATPPPAAAAAPAQKRKRAKRSKDPLENDRFVKQLMKRAMRLEKRGIPNVFTYVRSFDSSFN